MRDYNRIIESLDIKFIKARNISVLQPLTIENFYDVENMLVILNRGNVNYTYDNKQHSLALQDILFIPGGKPVTITYGSDTPVNLNNEYFANNQWKYFQATPEVTIDETIESFSYVTFDAKVFSSVNFFTSLDIPPFIIQGSEILTSTLRRVIAESNTDNIGNSRLVNINTEQLVIELIRHIVDNNMFVEKLATNSNYFKDPRLINIFNYIKENLGGDLSNRMLAAVAHVSEDYVGQYFKMLTGINPQDYIEYQRMEKAVSLLRTSKKSIREIGKEVGFKDTAYFCRRFKMMFGIPAGKMRRRETLMSI